MYSIPWNRKTERICLEMVHLNWQKKDRVRLVDWGNREEIQRTGNGLPDPPVWVNETGYEPFGQDDGDDDDAAESDPDESRNPSRPSKFYLPPASLLVDQDQNPRPPDAAVAFRYKPDPKALGEIYIPYSQVRTLCQRHISLVPTTPILGDEHQVQQQVQQEAHYNSSIPLLLLAKILRVTNITLIDDDSILNNTATYDHSMSSGPSLSPEWVDEHKVLDKPRIAEMTRLRAAVRNLLASGWERQWFPDKLNLLS